MSDRFSVEPGVLRDAAARFGRLGDGSADGVDLEGGQAWGGDEEGAAFGSAYSDVAEAARPAVTAVLEALATLSKGLTESADAYEATDTEAATSLDRLTGR